MRKINILIILSDHIATLYDDKSKKLSATDLLTFFAVPLALATLYFLRPFTLPQDTYGALIAVFSVFSALLFSAQIALYSLAPKEAKHAEDPLEEQRYNTLFERQKKYFADINSNVSYLILLSCISLILFLIFLVFSVCDRIAGPVIIACVSHFFLTLLMVIKRSHVAFSMEK